MIINHNQNDQGTKSEGNQMIINHNQNDQVTKSEGNQ
jgi:hypothetical protein